MIITSTPINSCPYMDYRTAGYWCKFFGKRCDEQCIKTISLKEDKNEQNFK